MRTSPQDSQRRVFLSGQHAEQLIVVDIVYACRIATIYEGNRAAHEATRRRLRVRARAVRVQPLADVLREHALVHLPPTGAARLRLVHPSWARRSGLFIPTVGFIPFDGSDDTMPSPSFSFAPASSDVTVLSLSHGVACCFSPADDALFVCNPATASWSAVPSLSCRTWPRPAIVVLFDVTQYNFGGDYALVCAAECEPGSGAYCFQVFTYGTCAWRFADAIAPAEGLVAASSVAAGGGRQRPAETQIAMNCVNFEGGGANSPRACVRFHPRIF